jgi:transcriptional regulator with XRE-family HTH domain
MLSSKILLFFIITYFPMKIGQNTTAERLRQWGKEHFKTMAAFAVALGMNPSNLNDYLSGRTLPGNSLQERLRALGCDIEWLMTGTTLSEKPRIEIRKHYHAPPNISASQAKKIEKVIEMLEKNQETDIDKVIDLAKIILTKK